MLYWCSCMVFTLYFRVDPNHGQPDTIHSLKKKDNMHKAVLILVMMISTILVGCETVRQIQTGCFGYWEGSGGHKRGTRLDNQNNAKPYRQCVDENPPHQNTEQKPYG